MTHESSATHNAAGVNVVAAMTIGASARFRAMARATYPRSD